MPSVSNMLPCSCCSSFPFDVGRKASTHHHIFDFDVTRQALVRCLGKDLSNWIAAILGEMLLLMFTRVASEFKQDQFLLFEVFSCF
jgi:hypothetical protein